MKKRDYNKMSLPPLANSILWLLEEAGGETVTCVVNTLRPQSKDSSPADFLKEMEKAVNTLFRLGLVTVDERHEEPVKQLTSHVIWDGDRDLFLWTGANRHQEEPPEIVLTDEGIRFFRK